MFLGAPWVPGQALRGSRGDCVLRAEMPGEVGLQLNRLRPTPGRWASRCLGAGMGSTLSELSSSPRERLKRSQKSTKVEGPEPAPAEASLSAEQGTMTEVKVKTELPDDYIQEVIWQGEAKEEKKAVSKDGTGDVPAEICVVIGGVRNQQTLGECPSERVGAGTRAGRGAKACSPWLRELPWLPSALRTGPRLLRLAFACTVLSGPPFHLTCQSPVCV